MNEVCPTCYGSGGIEVFDYSAGEVITITCSDCGGSGEVGGWRTEGYTNEQFLKASKYIVESLEKLNKAIDDSLPLRLTEIERQMERYREALEFYANRENYEPEHYDPDTHDYTSMIDHDKGATARKALEGEE